jgi:hypothetical protein
LPKSSTAVVCSTAGDQAHVVVDEDRQGAGVLGDPADHLGEVLGLLVGQAGGRLVEQDQPGPADDRAGDLDQAALAGAERADLGVRDRASSRRTRSRPARPCAGPRRAALECSWIIATLSYTDSSSIACSVWNVRRTPQRARRKWAIASRSRRTRGRCPRRAGRSRSAR